MRIDHVIFGCVDLAESAARFQSELGLNTTPGGRHPGGTVNCVVAMDPPQYLEVIAVEDAKDEMTRDLDEAIRAGRTLLGWALEADDIDAVARRVGREVQHGSITAPDGAVRSWRLVVPDGHDLPFFINYGPDRAARIARWDEDRTSSGNEHVDGFSFVEVGGDKDGVRAWIGDADLPIRHVDGRSGLHRIGIATRDGEIVISDDA